MTDHAAEPEGEPDAPSPGRRLAAAGFVVSAAFLGSRVLGWVRTVVLIGVFGASAELDAFFAAFRLPDLVFQLVAAGALGSALVPVASGLLAADHRERAWRLVSTVANLMLVGLAALAIVLALAAPLIVPVLTPGFDAIQTAHTVELTRIMLLGPVFLAMGAVASSALNAAGRFAAAAVAPIVYNLAIIASAVVLSPFLGVRSLAIGVVAGSILHLLVQLPALRRAGMRYEPVARVGDPHARRTLGLMAPRALGLGAAQIAFAVVTALASTLGTGGVTAWNAAWTVVQMPIGVIGVPLGVVLLPSLARQVAAGHELQYVALITRGLRLLLYVMLPVAGLLVILRRQTVALLFPGLDERARDLTADALLFFLVGLAAHALIALLARAFFARQDTRTPVGAALLAVVVTSVLATLLVAPLGLGGVALAVTVATWLEALLLLRLLLRRVPAMGTGDLVRVGLEGGLATIAAGAFGLLVLYAIDGMIGTAPGLVALAAQAIVVSVSFAAVFVTASVLMRVPELRTIAGLASDLARTRGAA